MTASRFAEMELGRSHQSNQSSGDSPFPTVRKARESCEMLPVGAFGCHYHLPCCDVTSYSPYVTHRQYKERRVCLLTQHWLLSCVQNLSGLSYALFALFRYTPTSPSIRSLILLFYEKKIGIHTGL